MPTLLIYDIEDDGHPIWQGKLLFKQLKNSKFLTYRNSQDPYWVPDNIWNKMLEFFASNSSKYTRVPKFKEDKKRNKSEDNVRRQSSLIARPYVSQSKQ